LDRVEATVRGQRASIARQKVDLVIVSVRYEPEGQRLTLARAYERRGKVWSDLRLYDRQALITRLRNGDRIVTGSDAQLAGDFQVLSPVRLQTAPGEGEFISANGAGSGRDDLGLPLF
jgi:hypothetical protein